jgi:hypothetical protein
MHEMQDLPIVLDPRALGKHVVSITKNIHFLHLVSSYIYMYIASLHIRVRYCGSPAQVWAVEMHEMHYIPESCGIHLPFAFERVSYPSAWRTWCWGAACLGSENLGLAPCS